MTDLRAVEEEIYTHEYLWRSASLLLQKAEEEAAPSYHFLLPALMMSFMAYEAFVNFCGFVLVPEVWKEEKKYFKNKGIEGKLAVMIDKLPNFVWRKGEMPYQRIKELEAFRDIVAHGKVLASQYVAEWKEDGNHFQFTHVWDQYMSVAAVKEARAAISSFCQLILAELRKESDHPHLSFDAFEGSLASGGSKPNGG
jgi:hypothetical protein